MNGLVIQMANRNITRRYEMKIGRKEGQLKTGEDLLSKCPSEGNVGLTGRRDDRGSIGRDKGVQTTIVKTSPISEGNVSHFKERWEMVIQVAV